MTLSRPTLRFMLLAAVAMGPACQTDDERPGSAGEPGASARPGGDPGADVGRGPGSGFGPGGEWVLTPTRVGPVGIGASFESVRPHLEEPSSEASPSDDCRIVRPAHPSAGLTLMVWDGRIVRVDVTDLPTSTAEGARVGDTEARVLELYPDARRQPHKYTAGSYLVALPLAPADTLHRYVFETDGARVTRFRAGIYPQVEWVEGCS